MNNTSYKEINNKQRCPQKIEHAWMLLVFKLGNKFYVVKL